MPPQSTSVSQRDTLTSVWLFICFLIYFLWLPFRDAFWSLDSGGQGGLDLCIHSQDILYLGSTGDIMTVICQGCVEDSCVPPSYSQHFKVSLNILETISVQFSHSVMSDSLWPHGLQHARLLWLSPTPGVYSISCPLSQWCHPNISSSVIHFFCLQSFPASGSFPMSQFFALGGQRLELQLQHQHSILQWIQWIQWIPSKSIFPWFPLGLTGLISLQSKGLSWVFPKLSRIL